MVSSAMTMCSGSKGKPSAPERKTPKEFLLPADLPPTHSHNSPGIMTAPITGDTSSGDGESDRGRALHFGEESGLIL